MSTCSIRSRSLTKLDGKPVPDSIGKPSQTSRGTGDNTLMASRRKWKQYGQSGLWVSDWYSNIGEHVDDLTVIRSCWADGLNHVGSVCQMNTGSILAGRPSMGAWVTYGLGTANQNLPSFVVLSDGRDPLGGGANWNSGFLPALYQGTQFRSGDTPILDLKPPAGVSDQQQRNELGSAAKAERNLVAGQIRRHRTGRANPVLRAGLPDAVGRLGRRRSFQRVGRDSKRCTAWTTPPVRSLGPIA